MLHLLYPRLSSILLLWFLFILIAHLLDLNFVITYGFNHVGNSRTSGPRGKSLTNMLSPSSNLQLSKGSELFPLQVCIPAASYAPGLVPIWPCGELIQLTGWTENPKEQSEYFFGHFSNLKVAQRGVRSSVGRGRGAGPGGCASERAALSFLAGVSCVWDWLGQLT